MKRALLAGVGLLALSVAASGPAGAAEIAASTLPQWSWSGFYLGAHAGYAWARDPMYDAVLTTFPSGPIALTDISAHGWLAGFQAGVNWQNGAWLGGLELDMSGTGIQGSTSVTNSQTILGLFSSTETVSQTDKFDMLGSGRVRLGFLPWPNVLLYGTGGLAWARIDQTQTTTLNATGRGITSSEIETITTPSWRFGWAAGVGVETRLSNSNWLARVEYLHYDFGDSGNSTFDATFTSSPITVDVVRGGLSYKFGAGAVAGLWPVAAPPIFTKAPRQASVPWSWSGFYIGAHGGYGWTHDPFSELDVVGGATVTLSTIDARGALGGFQAGANWQKGSLVGGLEIDLSATSISGASSISGSTTIPGATTTGTLTEGNKFPLLGSARARFGYLVWPTTLLYGTAGLAWTRQDDTTVDTEAQTGPGFSVVSTPSSSVPNWRFGWVAGLGVEKRIADTNLLARVEYLHYDFGDTGSELATDTAGGATATAASYASGHITADVLRAGVSYKFGGSDAGAAAPALVTKAPRNATASWSGFYIGAHGGYGWGRDPFTTDEFPFNPPDLSLTGVNSSGWLGGFQAGANWQADRFVVGAELDFSATGIKGTASGTATAGGATNVASQTDQFDWLGSGRARAGFLPMPDLLVYGTGGLAWTRFTQSFVATEITPNDTSITASTSPAWRWGWVAGLGAETRIGHSNWLGRAEYLHYDFGTSGSDVTNLSLNGAQFSIPNTTGRLTADVVRAGVSYLLQ